MLEKPLPTWFLAPAVINYQIQLTAHVIVPIIYWIFLSDELDNQGTPAAYWSSISKHGGDFVMIFIDFILNQIPVLPSHSIFMLALVWLYIFCIVSCPLSLSFFLSFSFLRSRPKNQSKPNQTKRKVAMVVYAARDMWIYPFLDYTSSLVAVYYIGFTLAAFLLHLMWWGLTLLKQKYFQKPKNDDIELQSQPIDGQV